MKNDTPSETSHPNAGSKVRKVVLIGHCGFDQASLSRAVTQALPDVAVTSTNGSAGLEQQAGPDTLLLINRVLDGRFGTRSGIDLICELAKRDPAPTMMLISNFPDAQAQAVEAGALPGFGKSEMGAPATVAKLQAASAGTTSV